MDPRRLRTGEWIAGICGVVLLGAMFLDWYGIGSTGQKRSAWEAFTVVDVVLALAGLFAVTLALTAAANRGVPVTVAMASLLSMFGIVATAVVAYRTASPPDIARSVMHHGGRPTGYIPSGGGVSRELGVWLGLAATAGLTLGAMVALRSERYPPAMKRESHLEVERLPAPPADGAAQGSGA
jgi:hypothetical protein